MENCDVKEADRDTLLQEHVANQRILDKLGKRQKLIRDEHKRREVTERAAMKKQMTILQQQLKTTKDNLRVRDRQLRHLSN